MKQVEKLRMERIDREDSAVLEQTAHLEAQIFPDPWSAHEIEATVKQKHTLCAAVREGDTLLGYFLCYYVLDECEIARIAVAKEARRRGIGGMLMEGLKELCREKGITKILLDVRKSNRVAIIFYEKNGFVTDGVRRNYYGGTEPEDAVLMSCAI